MDNSAALYSQIGKRVRELRQKKQLSQTRLAEIVGLKRTSITNIEKGRQKILVHTLWDLAEALSVNPKDLLPVDAFETPNLDPGEMPKDASGKEREWLRAVIKGGGEYAIKKKAS